MPFYYTNTPFTIQANASDPDQFPGPETPSYIWTQTGGTSGGCTFSSVQYLTPTIICSVADSYEFTFTAFDGALYTSSVLDIVVSPLYQSTKTYSATCPGGYFGLSSTKSASFTSVISQADADTQALSLAQFMSNATVSCWNSSYKVSTHPLAPSGTTYSVYALNDADFSSDFTANAIAPNTAQSGAQFLGSWSSPGSGLSLTFDMATVVPFYYFMENVPLKLALVVTEPTLIGLRCETDTVFTTVLDPSDTDPNNNVTVTARNNYFYYNDVVKYTGFYIPVPDATRFTSTQVGRIQPPPIMNLICSGWDYVGKQINPACNALGLFILTGGTPAAPTSETLLAAINTTSTNDELSSFNGSFNSVGFVGNYSRYGANGTYDAQNFTSVFHTGKTNDLVNHPVKFIGEYVKPYVDNNVNPIYVYFRSGVYSGGAYTWLSNSIELNVESSSGSTCTVTDLASGPGILPLSHGVLVVNDPKYLASVVTTIRNSVLIYYDLYNIIANFPTATQLFLDWFDSGGAHTTIATIPLLDGSGNYIYSSSDRYMNCLELVSYSSTLRSYLYTNPGHVGIEAYLKDSGGVGVPGSVPYATTGLTNYTPTFPSFDPNPAGAWNIYDTAHTKMYLITNQV